MLSYTSAGHESRESFKRHPAQHKLLMTCFSNMVRGWGSVCVRQTENQRKVSVDITEGHITKARTVVASLTSCHLSAAPLTDLSLNHMKVVKRQRASQRTFEHDLLLFSPESALELTQEGRI